MKAQKSKKSKQKIVPAGQESDIEIIELDIPKPILQKKQVPVILNTKQLLQTKVLQPAQQATKKLTIEDITTNSQHKFKID